MDISVDSIKAISEQLQEPEWIRKLRLDAFEEAEKLPVPQSRYTKLPGFSIKDLKVVSGASLYPEELMEEGDFVQVDNRIVKLSQDKDNPVIVDAPQAFKNYTELIERYIFNMNKRPVHHNKFEMLTFALFTAGVFVYVPSGFKSSVPLYINFFLYSPSTIMFAPVVIIADKGSDLKIIQSMRAINNTNSVISDGVYVFLEEGAHVEYISIREPGESVYSFTTFRSTLKNNALLEWRHAWFGGRCQNASFINTLEGEGASVDEVQVFFLDKKEHLDVTSRLEHISPRSTSRVLVKGALRDRARAVFQGNVRIEKDAQETDSFLSDHVLLLNPGARADSIPGLEIEANQVRASHSASIGQIDEEQVFYLMSRGLDESEAKKTIVSGFLSPAVDSIPDELVRDKIWKSFESKWER